ncbi:amidohydrolase family protein [Natronosalvus caseinilyticus]|uniref:amidohydrolase family protein n=1 Tax=Natronosalvus caseinilyticus TaxID=2953747 RepID=UPI0028AD8A2E|nr:amidohydrolase family protein [Natronosalvus caseinilyticus]
MLELEHDFRVVDVHARLSPDGRGDPSTRVPPATPDRMEREMHQAGIVRAVVFPGTRPDESYVAANNGVARRSVERPFVAFARINGVNALETDRTGRFRNAVSRRQPFHTTPEDVEQYAYDDRFHGFVLDPAVDGVPDEAVLAELEAASLPVIVRGSEDAPPSALVDPLLDRGFPAIVSHGGGPSVSRPSAHTFLDLLETVDDCYLETSGVRYREVLERALLEHPDRVLFGSGAPDWHPNVAIMEILTLDVSADKLRRAFSKNACRVIDSLRPE